MATLAELRAMIDDIDVGIVDLIASRQACAARMARAKHSAGVPIRDDARRRLVLDHVFECAVESGVDPTAVQRVFELLIEMSEVRQRECQGDGNLP
ncbi:MAG: chorismate mutase [Methanospirillum sp.]|nr:chorismate mutase [Methanospirillum sp.]